MQHRYRARVTPVYHPPRLRYLSISADASVTPSQRTDAKHVVIMQLCRFNIIICMTIDERCLVTSMQAESRLHKAQTSWDLSERGWAYTCGVHACLSGFNPSRNEFATCCKTKHAINIGPKLMENPEIQTPRSRLCELVCI